MLLKRIGMNDMETIIFPGRILIIGCGAVSQCLQPLLLRHFVMDFSRITIIDPEENNRPLALLEAGASFVKMAITRANYASVFSKYVGRGDLIIDLAVDLATKDLLQWCHDNGVLYINTSVELWKDTPQPSLSEKTLYPRHIALKSMVSTWREKGPSLVVEHGANPGLVSHWTKLALESIAGAIIHNEQGNNSRKQAIENALSEQQFPRLAWLTGTKVIHIAERDMQATKLPKKVNEFVNTWSVNGLYEEATAPAELGWGTHEPCLPRGGNHHGSGPKNQIYLDKMGMDTFMYSWVPTGAIIGMLIRHGEAFTISNYLTVREDDRTVYRPTVHYVYLPSDSTCDSLHELRMNNYRLQPSLRILNNEITTGSDELGVLLLGHDLNGWWTGSTLHIDETRTLVEGQNATTLQVAASVLGALFWMISNPLEGFCVPDDLPYKEILRVANPYLGTIQSMQVAWNPLHSHHDHAGFYQKHGKINEADRWQFNHFRVNL